MASAPIATPRLATDAIGGLRLEPFEDRHATAAYVGWLNDPEVVRFSELRHSRHTAESCAAYRVGMAAAGNPYWAIEWGVDGAHVGNVAAAIDRSNGVGDLSIIVGVSSARGRGVGRAAWRLALDWLIGPCGLRKATGGTMAANTPMRRLFEASGMTLEGRRPEQFLLNGAPVDLLLYGVLARREE